MRLVLIFIIISIASSSRNILLFLVFGRLWVLDFYGFYWILFKLDCLIVLFFLLEELLKTWVLSDQTTNNMRNRVKFDTVFLMMWFALPKISSSEKLCHFLVFPPQTPMWFPFHLQRMEIYECGILSILHKRPLSCFFKANLFIFCVKDKKWSTWLWVFVLVINSL